MGNICGNLTKEEKEQISKSRKIDSELNSDKKHLENEYKLLLAGSGESGKSTIAKQIKIIHLKGFNPKDRQNFKNGVFLNISWACHSILDHFAEKDTLYLDKYEPLNQIPKMGTITLTTEAAGLAEQLWAEQVVQQAFTARELILNDSAPYFLSSARKFADPQYEATDEDILKVRSKTTGIVETIFGMRRKWFRLVDVGGQKNERRKWIHCFENVTAVMYVSAISEYDRVMAEDGVTNRLHDSLNLFEELINMDIFSSVPIILFLNKKDLFAEKLKQVELSVCFGMYSGSNDYDDAVAYIEKKFKEKNQNSHRDIFVHQTCATDTNSIKVIFSAVMDIALRACFQELGFDDSM